MFAIVAFAPAARAAVVEYLNDEVAVMVADTYRWEEEEEGYEWEEEEEDYIDECMTWEEMWYDERTSDKDRATIRHLYRWLNDPANYGDINYSDIHKDFYGFRP